MNRIAPTSEMDPGLGCCLAQDQFFEPEEFGDIKTVLKVNASAFGVKNHAVHIIMFPTKETLEDGTTRSTTFIPGTFTEPETESGRRIVQALRDRMNFPDPGQRLNWAVRNKHICASEMGAWVNLCPYAAKEATELKLSTGRDVVLHWKKNKRDTSAFQSDLDRGHREEPVFIDIMRQVFGLKCVDFPMGTLCSGKMAATPDGLGANGLFGMEIKSSKSDIRVAVPMPHYLQIQTNMACTAETPGGPPLIKDWIYVSGTTGGNRPNTAPIMLSVFHVRYNEEVCRKLRAASDCFEPLSVGTSIH